MSCRGECTSQQGTYRHTRDCVDNQNRVIVEHIGDCLDVVDEQTGVISYRWRCSCGASGTVGTEQLAKAVWQAHAGLRRLTTDERRQLPVVQVVGGGR